jgi:hypothetical protein
VPGRPQNPSPSGSTVTIGAADVVEDVVVVGGSRADEVGDMLMLGSGMLVVKVGVRCSESIDISSAMLELHSS